MLNHYKKLIYQWIATGIVVAIVVFVGWWGVAKMNQGKVATVAKLSQNTLAPDFTLPSTTGGTITLSDYRGKKNILIYFHEGLSCQPCWEQIPGLEKQLPEFEKMNVLLLSVSLDSIDKWKETIDRYKIMTPVLSYENAKTEQDYNLLPFSMAMGRRAGHTFVLVGIEGTIKWRKDYWPGNGMMVAGGVMSVDSKDIVQAVKENLKLQ
jgi:peroxiredoxin Q/BCP